ncbi:MAG TPA: methyltransferase domain-containing protein [Planctomycetota bacterium]|nr:methyltransferase domain-containing protein [Planctomycetota bacterium]
MAAPSSIWNAELYDASHSFVWKLAGQVCALLDAKPGERILDLGCGTGHLTQQLADAGATVVGLDASREMIEQARREHPGLRFELGDAHELEMHESFDAVFSNAALHWMLDMERVFGRVFAHVKPGGRFVFEMGGARNLQTVREAIEHALRALGAPTDAHGAPKNYLSVAQACTLLDRAGFEVVHATWTERPTKLEGEAGLRKWIEMFGGAWLEHVPPGRREDFFTLAEEHARPALFRDGRWIADYKRLRVRAVRSD